MRTTILVADDEPPMRKYISSNLKVRGYDVIVAADGVETLKLAGEYPLDLILLDIGMATPTAMPQALPTAGSLYGPEVASLPLIGIMLIVVGAVLRRDAAGRP